MPQANIAQADEQQKLLPANGYHYSGVIAVDGVRFEWKHLQNREVVLRPEDGGAYKPLGDYRLSEAQQLQLANTLLAQYRPHAMPDMNGYYAASAVTTGDGHLFLGVNNEVHIKDAFAGRGCGETSALRNAQDGLHKADVKISRVYLMSGRAQKPNGKLIDLEPGHVGCLCGECRDNLRPHADADTRFIMLPTNDGALPLSINRQAGFASELKPGEAWEIPYAKMYPLPEYVDKSAKLHQAVRRGFLHITDMGAQALPIETPFTRMAARGQPVTLTAQQAQDLARAQAEVDMSVPGLAIEPTLTNINRAMVQLIKQAYAEHGANIPEGGNLKITVVLVKGDNGQFYPGVSVVGEGWMASKPQEFAAALSNALNRTGFSEVYMMSFDQQQLLGELGAGRASPVSHALKQPEPSRLGRLIKNLLKADNPPVMVLPVNDGSLSESELCELSHRVGAREGFGPHFTHPKSEVSHVRN